MISHLKNKGGIYIIINKISRNYYIGSASINKLYTRFCNHMLNYKGNKLVKRAILKDGLNNFIFAILEYYPKNNENNIEYNNAARLSGRHVSSSVDHYTLNLFKLEIMYISLLTPKYNIITEANSNIEDIYTDDTIDKLKSSFTKECRLLLSQLQSRYNNNLSVNLINNKPIKLPYKEHISNTYGISIYNINNEYICKFKNINTASHYLCCSNKIIQRSLNIS